MGGGTKRSRSGPGYTRSSGYYGRFSGAAGELKFFDLDSNNSSISNTGDINSSWNLIAQGVTENTRVGRKCTIKIIEWKWNLILPEINSGATAGPADIIRMILYVDKQANGQTAAVEDILESTDFQSFYNLANQQRFRIILDKTTCLNAESLAYDGIGAAQQASHMKAGSMRKLCNIPIEYSSVTGALTEIRSNNIGLLVISKSNKGALVSKVRMRFSD